MKVGENILPSQSSVSKIRFAGEQLIRSNTSQPDNFDTVAQFLSGYERVAVKYAISDFFGE